MKMGFTCVPNGSKGLTLGDLESVSITSSNNSLVYTNLWLDTGNDGKFFQFGGSSGEQLMSLNGDTYLGGPAGGVNSSSIFDIYAGVGSGSYTLAQLQSGTVTGIDANTRVALWVGIAGNTAQSVNIPSITVTTVPEPSSLVGMGTGRWPSAVLFVGVSGGNPLGSST